MESEWYDINPVGWHRTFITGQDANERHVSIELSETERNALNDFQFQQRQREKAFLRELVKAHTL